MEKIVLAVGQSTGNSHVLHGTGMLLGKTDDEDRVVTLPAGGTLVHAHGAAQEAEHLSIALPQGKVVVSQKREYRPDGWVTVSD